MSIPVALRPTSVLQARLEASVLNALQAVAHGRWVTSVFLPLSCFDGPCSVVAGTA